ncbi:membrane protein insertase YidC [Neptuniibacter sp. CAU 1671]|uniref:membrane protein insertase YidC n=1 Tax=Neptuniibacter sp. CAU 1671 TaxID=3032593 RepID=UPI0023DB49AB|nr:membrane protein insertase YidC [Neptuniibacter sp. CAU 1671]MDF2182545.1 membrane protein insertase YidC [Neptuniibacter sp. CAU 1671]
MDVQRIILIIALSIVSYMLVLQWNADYGEKPVPQAAVVSQSAYSSNSETELPQTTQQSQPDMPATGSETVKAQLISVKTDVLNLLIDTKGGDIIQVSLPAYKAALESDLPFVLLEQTADRTYVAQSGLVGTNGPDAASDGRPVYTSESSEYSLTGDALSVDLTFTDKNGVIITKRFTFSAGSYAVKQEFLVNNQSEQTFSANLFGQIKRDRSADPSATTSMGMQSYLGPVFSTQETRYEKYSFDKMDEAPYKQRSLDGWVAMSQHYFLSAWIPAPGAEYNYQTRKLNGNYIAGFLSPVFNVEPGKQQSVSATLYVGPKLQEEMALTQEDLKLTVDYGWLWWVASPLHTLLKWIYDLVGNWGLAIIGITILVKAALFQLNAKAFKSMAKMRKFGPEMQRLKELYGDDRQKMSQEMMKLYQKEKINPLGGCLPIVAQMPIFIALYWVLMESVELRHAEFLYLTDLSVQDPFFILPILMGVSMFIQQSLNPTPPDPMQAKIMKMLPIVFTFFFLWFPAGLTLYWVVNNILSIAQQYVINKQIENGTDS